MRSLKTLKQASRDLQIPLATREEVYRGTGVTRWSEGERKIYTERGACNMGV